MTAKDKYIYSLTKSCAQTIEQAHIICDFIKTMSKLYKLYNSSTKLIKDIPIYI